MYKIQLINGDIIEVYGTKKQYEELVNWAKINTKKGWYNVKNRLINIEHIIQIWLEE